MYQIFMVEIKYRYWGIANQNTIFLTIYYIMA